MQIGRSNTFSDTKYFQGDCLMFNLTSDKDLGVTIVNKFNFIGHISIMIGKAHACAYLIIIHVFYF